MVQHTEFQGRTLDDAIREACEYYGLSREKLEIEIISDAKSGIFGLVGAKKAVVRARRAEPTDTGIAASTRDAAQKGPSRSGSEAEQTRSVSEKNRNQSTKSSARRQGEREAPEPPRETPAIGLTSPGSDLDGREQVLSAVKKDGCARAAQEELRENTDNFNAQCTGHALGVEALPDGLAEFTLEACDQEALFDLVRQVVLRLVDPIVGPVACEVTISGARIRATLDCGDAAGLLVGRDGQTLGAVQYLASRIISRRLGGAVRLQIDAGKYRERQDDKLIELALSLAARAKETGRAQSTRPLTAYQRRVVHLALEGDAEVQTQSRGDGSQRKVVICLKSEAQRTGAQRTGAQGAGGLPGPRPASGGRPRPLPDSHSDREHNAHRGTPPEGEGGRRGFEPADDDDPTGDETRQPE